jgi:hypothetical protein
VIEQIPEIFSSGREKKEEDGEELRQPPKTHFYIFEVENRIQTPYTHGHYTEINFISNHHLKGNKGTVESIYEKNNKDNRIFCRS